MIARGVDLLAVGCDALEYADEPALFDLLSYADPDIVYVLREGADVRVASRIRRAFDGPVIAPGGPATCRTETVAGITVVFADSTDRLENRASADVPPDADYVVCDDLAPTTDRVALEASLEGLERIGEYQRESAAETVFCTGSFPAGYDYVWHRELEEGPVRLPVRGLGPIRRSGGAELARLRLGADGSVSVSSVPADRFGLGALSGVGPTTAERLRKRGYDSRRAVADASVADLRSIRGIGESTAVEMQRSARAMAESRVIRRTADPVAPVGNDPLFVDIETDGLHPTVIPLIGVFDPDSGEYVDFVDSDPSRTDPGTATRAFIDWLAATHDDPTLAAWNGYGFDFPHIERFVARYAPEYREYWTEHVSTVDPYDWAVRCDNAVLPGRTNRLEDVAAALGCERAADAEAIDGRTFAKQVRRLIEAPDSEDPTSSVGEPSPTADERCRPMDDTQLESEPRIDWERVRRYCEADVRELAAVYDALVSADPANESVAMRSPGERGGTTDDRTDSTTQTGLADFDS
ncbi:ribonuclease H-like domain-containing protein [Natrarchaeobius sp. A-rgal3]|uniref:ribonuclease H-like domain-containing protein n=1 Tax=Natrarchaeobius versutus TaxID=1679078 RepID=UPI0035101FB3